MDMEEKVVEALTAELQRQSEASGGRLEVKADEDGGATVRGRVDLEALAMAAVGSLAGGP